MVILTSVILKFHLILSSKCVYPITNNQHRAQSSYVECRNVRSMHELAADMKSNWRILKIINEVDSVFTNAGMLL